MTFKGWSLWLHLSKFIPSPSSSLCPTIIPDLGHVMEKCDKEAHVIEQKDRIPGEGTKICQLSNTSPVVSGPKGLEYGQGILQFATSCLYKGHHCPPTRQLVGCTVGQCKRHSGSHRAEKWCECLLVASILFDSLESCGL